jgi:hypothetical protein
VDDAHLARAPRKYDFRGAFTGFFVGGSAWLRSSLGVVVSVVPVGAWRARSADQTVNGKQRPPRSRGHPNQQVTAAIRILAPYGAAPETVLVLDGIFVHRLSQSAPAYARCRHTQGLLFRGRFRATAPPCWLAARSGSHFRLRPAARHWSTDQRAHFCCIFVNLCANCPRVFYVMDTKLYYLNCISFLWFTSDGSARRWAEIARW